jgi:peptidoglycan/xylan/chitin deacetylase (PgdA/CDA1 family)
MSPRCWASLRALAFTGGVIGAFFSGPRALAEDSVHIATWSGDRAGAFAYTFDDGIRDQVSLAAPMLDALGIKATFAINPGKTSTTSNFGSGTWDNWRALARNGHEIANHSQTHPNLSQVTDAMVLEKEIIGAKSIIEQEIGQPCITFVYPFNAESEASRAVVKKSHLVWTGGERKTYGGPAFTAAKANAWIDEAIAKKTLLIAMIHGIENGYLPFTGRAVFKEHLDYAKSKEAQVWIAPLGMIKRYEAERTAAKLVITSGANKCVIILSTTFEPRVYNVPLTIVIGSGSAKTVSAKRLGGGDIPAMIHGEHILCEIVPGPGEVMVTWK